MDENAIDASPRPARPKPYRGFYTTREVADRLGVSLRTVQLWTDSGWLTAWKTKGGHRRVTRESLELMLAKMRRGEYPELPEEPKQLEQPENPEIPNAMEILVIEDDPDLLLVYEIWFRRLRAPCRMAATPSFSEALILAGAKQRDLFICDLNLPGMSTATTLEILVGIGQMEAMKNTEIALVTSLSPADLQACGSLPEHIPILPKPISFQDLSRLALRAMARRISRSLLIPDPRSVSAKPPEQPESAYAIPRKASNG